MDLASPSIHRFRKPERSAIRAGILLAAAHPHSARQVERLLLADGPPLPIVAGVAAVPSCPQGEAHQRSQQRQCQPNPGIHVAECAARPGTAQRAGLLGLPAACTGPLGQRDPPTARRRPAPLDLSIGRQIGRVGLVSDQHQRVGEPLRAQSSAARSPVYCLMSITNDYVVDQQALGRPTLFG